MQNVDLAAASLTSQPEAEKMRKPVADVTADDVKKIEGLQVWFKGQPSIPRSAQFSICHDIYNTCLSQ